MFRDSFIAFLREKGIPFIEEDESVFSFPGKDTEICLVSIGEEPSGCSGIHLYEDRWRSGGETIRSRLLAHLGVHRSVYARKCEARKIGSAEASGFLDRCHSYGSARCRYRYGLYFNGELVAVATFSGKRMMRRQEGVLASYEWVRYASLPDVRVCGGMGKLMKRFVDDIHPEEIMSYADLEWSDGDVYRRLGFTEAGRRAPVEFLVDPATWRRTPVSKAGDGAQGRVIRNMGSIKYLKVLLYLQP